MKLKNLITPYLLGTCLTLPAFAGVGLNDGAPIDLSHNPQPVPSSLGHDWVPMLHKGTQELSVAGKVDWEDFSDIEYSVRLSYGWFIADGWEFGLTGSFEDQEGVRNQSFGFFTEYNFNRDSRWVPFIGLSAEAALSDIGDFNTNAVLLGGEIGLKYFIRSNIALTAATKFSWSSDDIFAVDDAFKETSQVLLLGMRFYF